MTLLTSALAFRGPDARRYPMYRYRRWPKQRLRGQACQSFQRRGKLPALTLLFQSRL